MREPSLDVRIWRHIVTSKVDPRTEIVKHSQWSETFDIGIQMKQKELT